MPAPSAAFRDTPFVKSVRERVEKMPVERLQAVVVGLARGIGTSQEAVFLQFLDNPPPIRVDDYQGLLLDIETFLREVAQGNFRYGAWGNSFGRKTWFQVMDSLLVRVGQLWTEGREADALDAWSRLIQVFRYPAYALGESTSPAARLSSNLGEWIQRLWRRGLALEAVRTSANADWVAPALQAVFLLAHGGVPRVSVDCLQGPDQKPEVLGRFLLRWLQGVSDMPDPPREVQAWYMADAYKVLRGIQGLEPILADAAREDPSAWRVLVKVHVQDSAWKDVARVARQGLERVKDPEEAVLLAGFLLDAAEETQDEALLREARLALWRQCPSGSTLEALCALDEAEGASVDSRCADELEAMEEGRVSPSPVMASLLEILAGDYETPAMRLKESDLGTWRELTHPLWIVLPSVLLAATGQEKAPKKGALAEIWNMAWLTEGGPGETDPEWDRDRALALRFRGNKPRVRRGRAASKVKLSNILKDSLRRKPMDLEQRRRFMAWMEEVVTRVVRQVLEAKERDAYAAGAVLVQACAQSWHLAGQPERGQAFLRTIRSTWPRHTSFLRDMDAREWKGG